MRYLRFILFLLFALLFHLTLAPVFIILAWILKEEALLYRLYKFFWRASYHMLGIKFTVEGQENIPPPPFIITPNHQSYIDGPFFIAFFPYRVKAMIKESIFRIPFIGQALRLANFINVKRESSLRASFAFKKAESLLRKGEVLLIFPEGTRTRDGSLGRFKAGACRLAAELGIPLLPVVFFNSMELLPRDKWIPQPGRVRVKFLPPITSKGKPEELCRMLREGIENALKED